MEQPLIGRMRPLGPRNIDENGIPQLSTIHLSLKKILDDVNKSAHSIIYKSHSSIFCPYVRSTDLDSYKEWMALVL